MPDKDLKLDGNHFTLFQHFRTMVYVPSSHTSRNRMCRSLLNTVPGSKLFQPDRTVSLHETVSAQCLLLVSRNSHANARVQCLLGYAGLTALRARLLGHYTSHLRTDNHLQLCCTVELMDGLSQTLFELRQNSVHSQNDRCPVG